MVKSAVFKTIITADSCQRGQLPLFLFSFARVATAAAVLFGFAGIAGATCLFSFARVAAAAAAFFSFARIAAFARLASRNLDA